MPALGPCWLALPACAAKYDAQRLYPARRAPVRTKRPLANVSKVAVITRRTVSRRTRSADGTGPPSVLSEDRSVSPDDPGEPSLSFTSAAPTPTSVQAGAVPDAAVEPTVLPVVVPPADTETSAACDSIIPEITNQTLVQILTSAHTAENRLTNEAAAALEFLARFWLTAAETQSTPQFSTSCPELVEQWDPFFAPEDAQMLLALHQAHLTWMHNVVHLPTFRQEVNSNLMQMECLCSWLALYYALLAVRFHPLAVLSLISPTLNLTI
ncbi:unnamed protein product [Clonostachys rosea]|uniref:Uncharacterized protein n=1 Tax=Bionectria ochroleuca TaxID=29856 RepID=A0ABY6TQY7_BIOOC|nr:unnamed protein product [Clonostachys rosea]